MTKPYFCESCGEDQDEPTETVEGEELCEVCALLAKQEPLDPERGHV